MSSEIFTKWYSAVINLLSLLNNETTGEEYQPIISHLNELLPSLDNPQTRDQTLNQMLKIIREHEATRLIYMRLVGMEESGTRFYIKAPGISIPTDWITFTCPGHPEHGLVQVPDARRIPYCPVDGIQMIKTE